MYTKRRKATMHMIGKYTIFYVIVVVIVVLLLSSATTTCTILVAAATITTKTFENTVRVSANAASTYTIDNNYNNENFPNFKRYNDNNELSSRNIINKHSTTNIGSSTFPGNDFLANSKKKIVVISQHKQSTSYNPNNNNEKWGNNSIYIPNQFYTTDAIIVQKEQKYISFPRWDTSSSNSVIDSILSFVNLQSQFFSLYNSGYYENDFQTKKITPLNLPVNYTLDHPVGVVNWKWPESFYIINLYTIYYSNTNKQLIHRWNKGTYILKMNTTELLIYNSIQLFHKLHLSTIEHENTMIQQRWPNLYHVLIIQNSSFPLLAHYSDYTGCNYHNWANYTLSIPLFTVAAQRSSNQCNYTFPFPNYYTISTAIKKQSSNWDTTFQLYTNKYGSYSNKISKIIWRGSLTGYTTKKIRPPRYRLFQLLYSNNSNNSIISEQDREFLFDVQLTSIPKGKELYYMTNNTTDDLDLLSYFTTIHNEASASSSSSSSRKHNKIPMDDFQYYKAILDIDGHSWSSRFGNILCTTSIVLKIQPDWVDYFYYPKYSQYSNNDDTTRQYKNNRLLPWKHYIPIRKDMSDLLDKVRYVVDPINEKHVLQIISNAQQWCRNRMTTREVSYDALDIFESYLNVLRSTGTSSISNKNNYLHNKKEEWTNAWTPTLSNSFIGQFANNHPQRVKAVFPMGF